MVSKVTCIFGKDETEDRYLLAAPISGILETISAFKRLAKPKSKSLVDVANWKLGV